MVGWLVEIHSVEKGKRVASSQIVAMSLRVCGCHNVTLEFWNRPENTKMHTWATEMRAYNVDALNSTYASLKMFEICVFHRKTWIGIRKSILSNAEQNALFATNRILTCIFDKSDEHFWVRQAKCKCKHEYRIEAHFRYIALIENAGHIILRAYSSYINALHLYRKMQRISHVCLIHEHRFCYTQCQYSVTRWMDEWIER